MNLSIIYLKVLLKLILTDDNVLYKYNVKRAVYNAHSAEQMKKKANILLTGTAQHLCKIEVWSFLVFSHFLNLQWNW